MTTELVHLDPNEITTQALDHYLATGDVSRMTDAQRAAFILHYANSIGVNAASGAIEVIEFWDPEAKRKVAKVYARAEALAQVGRNHRIRIETLKEEVVGGGLFKVTVRGHQPDGRTMDEVGYVSLLDRDGKPLVGNAYKNTLMKCHTVAKRRLVRAMTGVAAPPEDAARRLYLGPNAEILDAPTEEDRRLNDHPNEAAVSGRPRFESLEPPVETGLSGTPDQRPRPEDLAYPERPDGPAPTFKRDPKQVERWLGAWHGIVKGTPYEDADQRHTWFRQWTALLDWPQAKQTDSSKAFFQRCSDDEAADLLARIRLVVEQDRADVLADATNAADELTDDERPF